MSDLPNSTDLDKFASELRQAGFPGARAWNGADPSVKEVWTRVARLAHARIERAVDQALRQATAKAHELGQHAAAKAVREMRFAREE